MCKPNDKPTRRVRFDSTSRTEGEISSHKTMRASSSDVIRHAPSSSSSARSFLRRINESKVIISGGTALLTCGSFLIISMLLLVSSRVSPVSRSMLRAPSSHDPSATSRADAHEVEHNTRRLLGSVNRNRRDIVTRIVISCNMAFEQDMLNWWALCQDSGLCPTRDNDGHEEDDSKSSSLSEVVLYAEDEALYQKYRSSSRMTVRRSWETDTKFRNINLSGSGRFHIRNDGFKELVSRRPALLLRELERAAVEEHAKPDISIKVLFIDLDALIVKDPRPYITGDYDMWAADAKSDRSLYNSGFMVLRPTPNAIGLIRSWKHKIEAAEVANVNQISLKSAVEEADQAGKLKHKLLDDAQFPVGKGYPQVPDPNDEELWSKFDPSTATPESIGSDVVVFHNNWCHTICSKPHRAEAFGLWRPLSVEDIM